MIQKKYRLTARGDFAHVFKGNIRSRSDPFSLVCRKNSRSFNRFGFVVSLAVSKKAVRRNKLRRQLHEIVRSLSSSLQPGYDCVIQAYPGAAELGFDEIKQYVEEIFQKVGLYVD